LHCCDEIPNKNNLREEGFIFHMASVVSVHHGGKGVVEQSRSYHGPQEAKKETGTGDQE
jgi:hypothetical protein